MSGVYHFGLFTNNRNEEATEIILSKAREDARMSLNAYKKEEEGRGDAVFTRESITKEDPLRRDTDPNHGSRGT